MHDFSDVTRIDEVQIVEKAKQFASNKSSFFDTEVKHEDMLQHASCVLGFLSKPYKNASNQSSVTIPKLYYSFDTIMVTTSELKSYKKQKTRVKSRGLFYKFFIVREA